MIFEVAHHMALLPLAWLGSLWIWEQRRGVEWWWLASVFLVSWIADTAAHVMAPSDRWIVMVAYPVSQAALAGLVFLTRRDVMVLLGVLLAAGVGSVLWHGVSGPDVLLRTVAWGAIAGIVWDRRALGPVRTALVVAFGVGWVAWCAYAIVPGWWTWGAYQLVRAAGIALVCRAIWRPVTLRLSSHMDAQRQW